MLCFSMWKLRTSLLPCVTTDFIWCYTPTSYSANNANNELFLIYSEGIKGELDLITKHVCHEAPNEAECQEQLPAFWGAIAVSLFNPENGWFAADNICMVSFTKVI